MMKRVLLVFLLLSLQLGTYALTGSGMDAIDNENNCILPPPNSVWMTDVGSNYANAEWDDVPGAVEYEVTLIDLTLNLNVGTYYTSLTQMGFISLSPGHEYEVRVSASGCTGGPYEAYTSTTFNTIGIVIVDEIIQGCPISPLDPLPIGPGFHMNFIFNQPYEMIGFKVTDAFDSQVLANVHLQNLPTRAGISVGLYWDQLNTMAYGIDPTTNRIDLLEDTPGGKRYLQFDNYNVNQNGMTSFDLFVDNDVYISYGQCMGLEPNERNEEPLVFVQPVPQMKVSPNPAANQAWMNFTAPLPKDYSVQIVDMQGRMVFSGKIGSGQSYFALPVSDIPNGLYSVVLRSESEQIVKKLIISR